MKILLKRNEMFMVPLKDLVVFPRMVVPLFVSRRKSLHSVEEAMRLGRPLFLVAQKKTGVDEPDERDVHEVGTVSRVLQVLKLPDGKVRLLVEGLERAAIARHAETRESFRVVVRPLSESREITSQVSALMRAALSQFSRYVEVAKKVPPEAVTAVESADLSKSDCRAERREIVHRLGWPGARTDDFCLNAKPSADYADCHGATSCVICG